MSVIEPVAETRDTVTLRREDFEGLLNAAEDAVDTAVLKVRRAYEARVGWDVAKANYLTGDETLRLIEGEHPIRIWREKRGMSQRRLADAAQVSASYLAEIEAGAKPGSAGTLRKLAMVLSVPMEILTR